MREKVTILLITTSKFSASKIAALTNSIGYDLRIIKDLGRTYDEVALSDPKIVILDVTSFGLDDIRSLKRIRTDGSLKARAVMLIISKLNSRFEFDLEPDDFMYDDFSPEELRLRLELLLYRKHKRTTGQIIAVGDLVVDEERFEAILKGRPLELTFMEYGLLHFLILNREKVYTREALLSKVWGQEFYGGTRTVDVHIRRLRAKLGSEYENYIRTVRNVGYKFIS